MPPPRPNLPFVQLQRLQRVKQSGPPPVEKIGGEMVAFFKQSVEKRHTKLAKIADAWQQHVEEGLCEHCSLDSLYRGTLIVIVDSSAHLYQLKQLLLGGVEKKLKLACKSAGLRKISLKPGRWYEGDRAAERKITFD